MSHTTRPLNSQDYRTLGLAALGGALEFYDFIIFVFFVTTIGQLFFPPDIPDWLRQLQTYGIFAAGYLVRPLGGIVLAHFGDLIGRKKMFTFSILLMALPTLIIGLLPDYATIGIIAPLLLLLMRILQGAAIGGEVPGAWVFVSEHVPVKRIGLACGILTSGLTLGILIGSVVATIMHNVTTEEEFLAYGWRIPFFLGGIFGLIAMYLRRWLKETPIFVEMQVHKKLAEELPLKSVVLKHRQSVAISMLLTWMLSAGIVVVILMAPSWLKTVHHIHETTGLVANSIATIFLTLGCLIYGFLADKFGAKATFITGNLLFAVFSWCFYHLASDNKTLLFILYGLAGFSVGVIGVVPYIMVRIFPAKVRFSGISFSYNLAYAIFGGLTPVLVTMLTQLSPTAPAWYVMALAVIGVMIGFWVHPGMYHDDEQKLTHQTSLP